MEPRLARMLVRLYPRAWRARYSAEFESLLEDARGLRSVADVVFSALSERILPTRGIAMQSYPGSFSTVLRRPSAWLPFVLSITALAVVLGHVALYGTGHEADEGAAAHVWQILTAAQLPLIAFFAIRWLPRAPRAALLVLAVLAGTILANFAAVFFLT